MLSTIVMALNQLYTYIFYPNFGKAKFWLTMILVWEKLEANQPGPTLDIIKKTISAPATSHACAYIIDLWVVGDELNCW